VNKPGDPRERRDWRRALVAQGVSAMTKIMMALALVLGATSPGWAQSQPNYGPDGPAKGDCFGAPYSGTIAARCTPHRYYYHRR